MKVTAVNLQVFHGGHAKRHNKARLYVIPYETCAHQR